MPTVAEDASDMVVLRPMTSVVSEILEIDPAYRKRFCISNRKLIHMMLDIYKNIEKDAPDQFAAAKKCGQIGGQRALYHSKTP